MKTCLQSDSKLPLVETKEGFFPILFSLHKIASLSVSIKPLVDTCRENASKLLNLTVKNPQKYGSWIMQRFSSNGHSCHLKYCIFSKMDLI